MRLQPGVYSGVRRSRSRRSCTCRRNHARPTCCSAFMNTGFRKPSPSISMIAYSDRRNISWAPGTVVPPGALHLGAEPDVREHSVRLGHAFDVPPDLGLSGEQAGPLAVGREGVGIERRRHIACTAGVGVVPPGSGDRVGLLEDDEVDTVSAQVDRGTETGDTGTNDDHIVVNVGVTRRHTKSMTRGGVTADTLSRRPIRPHASSANRSVSRACPETMIVSPGEITVSAVA